MAENLTLINPEKVNSKGNTYWQKLAEAAVAGCPKIKKEREKEILFERFGIGKNIKTLNSIGKVHNVTRERIRQIVNNAVKKIQKGQLAPEIEKELKNIEKFVVESGGVITASDLYKKFGTEDKSEQNGIRFIANLSGELDLLKESNSLKVGWSKKGIKQSKIKEIAKKATDLLKEKKETTALKEIAENLKEDEKFVSAVLSVSKNLMKTDEGHWGLTSWPHVNPKSIRDKSKYIMVRHQKPIHYNDLTQKISDMGDKKVTKQSVHNELIKNEDFVLVGRGIYALAEWGYEPGVVEEVIVEILSEAGAPLHRNDIITKVLERRIVKTSTIVLNLQKETFKRVGKGIYTLN